MFLACLNATLFLLNLLTMSEEMDSEKVILNRDGLQYLEQIVLTGADDRGEARQDCVPFVEVEELVADVLVPHPHLHLELRFNPFLNSEFVSHESFNRHRNGALIFPELFIHCSKTHRQFFILGRFQVSALHVQHIRALAVLRQRGTCLSLVGES